MIAVGLDSGIAKCGYAVLDGDRGLIDLAVFTSKPSDRVGDTQARLAELLDWVGRQLDRVGGLPLRAEDMVVVEWPVVGGRSERGGRADRMLSGAMTFAAAGALVATLRPHATELLSPVPVQWRSAVAGGRVPTEDLHAQLEREFGASRHVGKTNAPHALDAIGCALYGLHVRALRDAPADPKPPRRPRARRTNPLQLEMRGDP